MSANEPTQDRSSAGKTAARISERYGVPTAEAEAVITDRPVVPGEPHPMTMGALLKDNKLQGSVMAQSQSRWTPAAIVGIVLGILGILAIAALLVFLLRWNKGLPQQTVVVRDTAATVQSTVPPPPPPPDSQAIPTDGTTVKPEPAPVTPEPVKKTVRRRPTALLSTSNSLEAEERLAELRASGYTKARIVRVTKRGSTIYQVRK